MDTNDNSEQIRQVLVTRYGSMWQAAAGMRLDISGGQLLLELRKKPISPAIAATIEYFMGFDPNKVTP